MKKLLVLFGIAGVAMLAWAASPRFPIKFGFLQSDLDANQQSVTNALNLVGTHWGDGLHLSNVTATASGAAAGVLSGTYPNPGFGTFSSATLATALSDENGGGPALFSTGDGGGLAKLNGLNITNWPTASLMGNPTGGSASVVPIPLDSTLSFVAGQLHAIGGGGSGSASNAVTQIFTNGVAAGPAVTTNLNFNGSSNIDVPATNGNGTVGVTPALNTNLTGMASISGGGSKLQFGGNPPGTMLSISNSLIASGGVFGSDTNGLPFTISNGGTNDYMTVINAVNYGLGTNGDQTANIQAAINAATNAGQTVFIPSPPPTVGFWRVNGTLHLGRQRLVGESSQSGGGSGNGTVLYHGSNNGATLDISGGNIGAEVGWISFLGDGTSNGFGITATNVVAGNGVQNFSIHDCTFKSLSEGIVLWRSWDGMLVNNYSVNCLKGMDFSNAVNGITILGGHFTGPNNSYGLYVQGGSDYGINLRGVAFELTSNAVFTTGSMEGLNLVGNYFEANSNNVVANAADGMVVSGNVFIQGIGSTVTNLVLVGCNQASIEANLFFDPIPAWDIDSTSTGVLIENNKLNVTAKSNSAIAASTWRSYDGTNFILNGGAYYGLDTSFTNGGGLTIAQEMNLRTNGGFSLNRIASTNVLISSGVLASSGNQTNYTIPLYNGPSGNMLRIFLANTNAFLTFTGTNSSDWQRTIWFDAVSNSVVSQITINVLGAQTNLNWVRFVTNGTSKVVNFYNPDTTGTNMFVSDAGTYAHK